MKNGPIQGTLEMAAALLRSTQFMDPLGRKNGAETRTVAEAGALYEKRFPGAEGEMCGIDGPAIRGLDRTFGALQHDDPLVAKLANDFSAAASSNQLARYPDAHLFLALIDDLVETKADASLLEFLGGHYQDMFARDERLSAAHTGLKHGSEMVEKIGLLASELGISETVDALRESWSRLTYPKEGAEKEASRERDVLFEVSGQLLDEARLALVTLLQPAVARRVLGIGLQVYESSRLASLILRDPVEGELLLSQLEQAKQEGSKALAIARRAIPEGSGSLPEGSVAAKLEQVDTMLVDLRGHAHSIAEALVTRGLEPIRRGPHPSTPA
jgi:hypothetical protein